MAKKINEATTTDLPIILKLINEYDWKKEDTLVFQQISALTFVVKNATFAKPETNR